MDVTGSIPQSPHSPLSTPLCTGGELYERYKTALEESIVSVPPTGGQDISKAAKQPCNPRYSPSLGYYVHYPREPFQTLRDLPSSLTPLRNKVVQPSNTANYHCAARKTKVCHQQKKKKVLPSLNDKHDACLLADLQQMWTNYKVMTKCLSGFFLYLDHHFVVRRNLPSLNDLATISFHNLVWSKLYGNFLDAAISLINQDRNGKQVQQDLLKDVLTFSTFFAEIGEQKIEYYETFEQIMLKEAASYYAQLASELLCCRSYTDYIQTVAWLLIQERERSGRYLQQGSVEKLLEIVKRKLMDETALLLVEKQKAECHDTATYQDLLSKCAGMSLGEESSVSPLTQWPFPQ
ncbi:hypothetical protein F2P56_019322 [Juglans regia]|uniref:Cullin N-terminal domain-containing protein n=1 Tax=Juglans regia TaxID=51240 RepID=A0A834CK36_JUGRE|nr:hypothetical protein F2P56_019322 [Juglans regia]